MIELFVPEKIQKKSFDLDKLSSDLEKKLIYASKGRYALYKIIKYYITIYPNKSYILLPAYYCETVYNTLKLLDIYFIFYDLDLDDLNPSFDSIEQIIEKRKDEILGVIIPSLYGNAANLVDIGQLCKRNNLMMIDDAAQSFGAELDGKKVGTYGEAGFFSFSPGKPTAAHMGSYYWIDNFDIKECDRGKKHYIYHLISYWYYIAVRQNAYKKNKLICKIVTIANSIVNKMFDIKDDIICEFENSILGGSLYICNMLIKQRNEILENFTNSINNNNKFRIIHNVRGISNPCKVVLLFYNINDCNDFKKFIECKIKYYGGYRCLADNIDDFPNTKLIVDHIVELPIETDSRHMEDIINTINEYINFAMVKE